MKKVLVLLLALTMILTLAGCGEKTPKKDWPIKTITLFDKEYTLPVKLEDITKNGVELEVVFSTKVKAGEKENVFLSKNGEYIRVKVYNLSTETKEVTDGSLVVGYISFQYNEGYTNAAVLPSVKIDGVTIHDDFSKLEKLYGEGEMIQLDSDIFEYYWNWEEDGCSIDAVKIADTVYAMEVALPKE